MRLKTVLQVSLISLAVVLLLATPAEANVGAGILVIFAPILAVVVLVPIVLIETHFLSLWSGVSAGYALWVVSVSNVVSTLVGIPITLMLLLPWSEYTVREERAPWVVPVRGLLLVMLFWAASWVIEYQVSAWMLPGVEPQNLNTGVLYGNLATYGIVAGFLLGWLIWEALSALRASLPILRPVEEAQEELPALLEAEAVEREVPTREGNGQYQPIEAEPVVAEAGLEFQRVLTNSNNGMQVKVPDTPNLVED